MERRSFLNKLILASAGVGLSKYSIAVAPEKSKLKLKQLSGSTFSIDDNRISYFLPGLINPIKIIRITDTHLWMDDQRGDPFKQYSQRMAKAYNTTRHFITGEDTNPVESFEAVLEHAVKKNADLLALTGDIFSFPSEAAIEYVYNKLKVTGIPYIYIAGNHDWHYEGMEGSSQMLRNEWTKKRLNLLYQGNDPLMASYKVKDINVIAIDNSTYEILPEQLDFFRMHARKGTPMIIMMHIPVYVPGRSMGYGCGNPLWGGKADRSFELERRKKWPESGHTKVTMDFCSEVFSTANVLGVFAGHVHQQSIDIVDGIPQLCTKANATGAYLEINFQKHPGKMTI